MDYRPIDCSLHDQYLAWATTRKTVTVEFQGTDGAARTISGVIADVYTSDEGAEWMVLADERIRLDRILRVTPQH